MRSFSLVPDAACFHHALRAAGSASDVSAVLEIMAGSGASPTVPVIVSWRQLGTSRAPAG
jgi:hypothetical protein